RYGASDAATFQRDGAWHTVSYDDLWAVVGDVALGLIDLGVEVGDRVAIVAETRYEFMVADLAISAVGGIVVPVYPANSAEECEWVLGDSGAVVAICENPAQAAKVESVRSGLPGLGPIVVID